jgi:hypothetical protein
MNAVTGEIIDGGGCRTILFTAHGVVERAAILPWAVILVIVGVG